MKKILSTIAASLLVVTTFSANANEGLYIGPSLSAYYLDSERYVGGGESPELIGFNIGYRFFNDWALEIGVGTEISNSEFEMAKIDFYYWFGEDTTGWRPYFTMGVAYYEQDVGSTPGPIPGSLGSGPTLVDSDQKYTHQGSIGFGLSKMLDPHWEFRGDVRFLHQIREGQEGIGDGSLNFALNYYFNSPVVKPAVVKAVPIPEFAPEPELPPEMRTIVVRLNVEFEFDKAVVRVIYGDELEAITNAMKAHDDIDLLLEGHTDAIGTDEYNQDLSERRVAAVKTRLAEDYGIDESRISTMGYGESRPIADNDSDEGRARNRRVIGELSYTEVVVD